MCRYVTCIEGAVWVSPILVSQSQVTDKAVLSYNAYVTYRYQVRITIVTQVGIVLSCFLFLILPQLKH